MSPESIIIFTLSFLLLLDIVYGQIGNQNGITTGNNFRVFPGSRFTAIASVTAIVKSKYDCIRLCTDTTCCYGLNFAEHNESATENCQVFSRPQAGAIRVTEERWDYLQLKEIRAGGGWHRMDIHLVANSKTGSTTPPPSRSTINNNSTESSTRGFMLMTVDAVTGRVGAMEEFPIFAQPNGYLRMVAYIADLPSSDLVLITTYDEASYAVDQSATSAAFATLGATDAFLGWRHCFCLIGCKSCGQSFPVVQVIKKASDSPCECYFSGYISFGAMTGGISNRVQAGSQARVNPS